MSEPLDIERDPALWRRWRGLASQAADEAAPDPLLVAAYAEGRLSEIAAERVEAWLAADPVRLEDIEVARVLRRNSNLAAPEIVLARASTLVDARSGNVVPFRRPTPSRSSWRTVAVWASMAASLLVTGLVGFALGSDAYTSLIGDHQEMALTQQLFDPPSGFFSDLSEESNT